ncbi:MAG: hypothetical protein MAG453_00493 [Calditrichaeota bacterium]|nr:hypothetical protein [Calditrichota bacterium]
MQTQNPFPDKPVESGVLSAIRHIDHVTYVTAAEHEKAFCNTWEQLGFHETVRLNTVRYPATR